jgi:DNA-directed RNA polymerase specialized sigma24 family protein
MTAGFVKHDGTATPASFNNLVAWLDAGGRSSGESYVDMHRRLASYFVRKGCREADQLADETLTRVARRLEEEGAITDVTPAQYCYIVARFVFLEYLRRPQQDDVALPGDLKDPAGRLEDDGRERQLTCLDACLEQLAADDRQLILEYYAGGRADRIASRRELAVKVGLSANALAIRACRLRERLRGCVADCRAAV